MRGYKNKGETEEFAHKDRSCEHSVIKAALKEKLDARYVNFMKGKQDLFLNHGESPVGVVRNKIHILFTFYYNDGEFLSAAH